MARFCIVAPPNILEALDAQHNMGGSHLLLAHDIVKHKARYHKLFLEERRNPSGVLYSYSDQFVILDNSVIELGHAVDIQIIAEAAATVEPTCVVLPDVMLKCHETIASCTRALEEWPKHFPKSTQWMIVPQGETIQDFIYCAEQFAKHERIGWWGIPRNITKLHGSRKHAIRACRLLNMTRPIHMLGFSDNMFDDIICARNEHVYSIDSAVPLRLQTELTISCDPGPRGDWWENAQYTPRVAQNLSIARSWFKGGRL